MTERVLVDIGNHVATVTMNRADKNNAVDGAMFDALAEAGDAISADSSVRAVVLHGAGGNFCAGIDISVFQGGGIQSTTEGDKMAPLGNSPANYFQKAAYVWREVPVPVIAAIQGYAFGAGLQIAAGADIRYGAPDARLCVMEIKWGLIPDMAITTTLRHVLPVDRLKELVYTGRIVSGQEAAETGLLTAIHEDPLAAALATAEEIAGKSPDAVRAAKAMVNSAWMEDERSALALEARLQSAIMQAPNQAESVMANIHKRNPEFSDSELCLEDLAK